MIDTKKSPLFLRRDDNSKSHEYNFDNRVFIVTPVYRKNGEDTKEILTKLMREEAQDKNAKPRF
jgi:hypothetical protein